MRDSTNIVDFDIEELASAGVHDKVAEIVARLPGDRILDAPTGHGALASRFLAMGRTVVAGDIDVSKFMLDPAKEERLTLVRLDLIDPAFPFDEGLFDIVVCVEGVEHLENQWMLARNLARVLVRGGHMVLSTPNILNFRSRVRFFLEGRYEFFKRPLVVGYSTPHDLETFHVAPVSYFELQFILERAGFTIREIHANKYSSRNIVSIILRPFFRLIYRYKAHRDRRRSRGDFSRLYQTIMSDEIYYGETLILVATKG